MVTTVYLCMEVVGCATVCRHCWAQGVPYGAMPLADIAWALEGGRRFCDDRGLSFDAYPMHEMAAHPEAPRLFRLFNEHSTSAPSGTMFEPLTTTGVPLATREDWRDVLEAAAEAGTRNLWLAFHGAGEEHDRQVNRGGAFAEACLAVERIRAAGLSVGCNVFVTADNLPRLDELIAAVRRLPIDADTWWGVAAFLPTARSRHNERVRPALPDLLPVAGRIGELTTPGHRAWWADLEAHTEAAHARRAAAGEWPARADPTEHELALVCRPNLDVHAGLAGLYRERHGNLRTDGVEAVLSRALAAGRRSDEELWFGDALPSASELAVREGEPDSLRVHPGEQSVRYLWRDRARRRARFPVR
jgi:hypothetical protein